MVSRIADMDTNNLMAIKSIQCCQINSVLHTMITFDDHTIALMVLRNLEGIELLMHSGC